MRVTFCTFDAPGSLSGPNSWLLRTIPTFERAGIECDVIVLAWRLEECTNIGAFADAGIRVAVVDERHHGSTESQVREILQICRQTRPDVFVANMMVPALFAARWLRSHGVPTVGVLRADNEFYSAVMDEFIFGRPEFRLSGVVCVSELLEQEVRKRHPVDTIVTRIPSGTRMPERVAAPPGSVFKLIYLGRLKQEQKRIREVTRALCRAAREIPGVEADIFGHGPDQAVVEQILASEGAGLPVRLCGRISPQDVLPTLGSRHALVLLSDYEGTPVAVMEAMAAGVVPICSWSRSGIPELVEDGVTGLIVQDRDADVVRAVRQLREQEHFWSRLSAAARERIRNGFSQEVVTGRWLELLTKLSSCQPVRTPVELPVRLDLPPVHPGLAASDHREPGLPRRILRAGKRWTRLKLTRLLPRFQSPCP